MQTKGSDVSRGNSTTTWRPLAVWAAVTAGAVTAAVAVPGAWRTARTAASHDRIDDLLVATCALALAGALAWLWAITTVTVAGLLAGRPRPSGGATRRLVLLACGAAVVAGTALPAAASGGDGRDLLVGLTLPERAAAPGERHRPSVRTTPVATTAAPETYVVRDGDSLWSIALDHPGHATSVDQRWRAIWQANRDVVGDDPDLIIPGQALRLPANPHSDGDR